MRYIADLHIHSKYSRACSKNLDLEHNEIWAKKKGIQIVGTGDFTHPVWFKELKEKLVEDKPGLFKLKESDGKVLFMLTAELSCIYKQGDKVRRIHLCVFAPSFESVEKIVAALLKRGVNISSDGRPIMGLHADELTKIILEADKYCMVIPAHAWTPWFSVFGSNSGFDTLEECFGEMTKYIYGIETGLSSDPPMNWRLSMLDNLTLISNSDAHSSANLGREANVFEIDEEKLSYDEIYRIIKDKDKKNFLYTIEFFPEEGKYHHDGHRSCNINFTPQESNKNKDICPICKKKLTIGVLNRVDVLADRDEGFEPKNIIPFKSLVPLPEVISEILEVGKNSKKVQAAYEEIIEKGGSEFEILLDRSYEEIEAIGSPEIAMAIKNIRENRVEPVAGYDGVYGVIKAIKPGQILKPEQKSLI
ncbi:MAG: DNA helicase UvrD [Parcubacteria group bacterium]|nr:DNA helicase UvrD [Parcubacteria group bacterium]|tara:strand:- start:148 stop:1404 length:1257 start_codon:yes stop_codon:yes gene_type:complete